MKNVQNITSFISVRIKRYRLNFIRASKVFTTLLFLFSFGLKAQGQTETTTTLTSSPNPSCLNEPVTLTATVDQIGATGNVHFWEGPVLLGNGTLDINGIATLTISNLSAGNHSITVVYDGESPFNGSSSAATQF